MDSPNFQTLKEQVIDTDLCTRCGTCVGICPNQGLEFKDVLGDCLPVAKPSLDCSECSAPCYQGCPGAEIDFVGMQNELFEPEEPDLKIGAWRELYIGWATDSDIRAKAASGGVITALLIDLLEKGEIDGAICLIDDPDSPLLPKVVIARDAETVKLSQQSKYSVVPVNTILSEVAKIDGRFAMVALPDQVQSIRKLQAIGDPTAKKIHLLFGSFCGIVQHFEAVTAFLSQSGIHDVSDIARVEYRAGEWPGKLRVTLKDGQQYELEKFYANYLSLLYPLKRSLLCVDLMNELADIAFGDAWSPRFDNLHEGYSLVMARSELGARVLDSCKVIELHSCSEAEVLEMHSHGLFNKKVAVWSRLDLRRLVGKPVPNYGYRVQGTLKSKLVSILIALVFVLGSSNTIRWIAAQLPLAVIGRVFLVVRRVWRKATRPKRKAMLKDNFKIILKPNVSEKVGCAEL